MKNKNQDVFKFAKDNLKEDNIKTDEISKKHIISEGIKHLQNYINPLGITRLTSREAALFSLANIEAEFWDNQEQKKALNHLAVLKFSQEGKSREEVKDTLIGLMKGGKPKKKGLFNKPQDEEVAENE